MICWRLGRWRKQNPNPFLRLLLLTHCWFRRLSLMWKPRVYLEAKQKRQRKPSGFSERVNGCCDSSFLLRSGKAEGGGMMLSDTSKALFQLWRHMETLVTASLCSRTLLPPSTPLLLVRAPWVVVMKRRNPWHLIQRQRFGVTGMKNLVLMESLCHRMSPWAALLCRGSQLQWEAGKPQPALKRSRERKREWQVCFPGWLSHADGLLPPRRKSNKTFLPFLYAHACSHPTVSCFKEPSSANTNLAPSFALFPAKKRRKSDISSVFHCDWGQHKAFGWSRMSHYILASYW